MIRQLNLPAGIIYIGPENARDTKKIIVNFTDAIDPTQEISFIRPFRHFLAERGNSIFLIPASQLERIKQRYDQKPIDDALDEAFKGVEIDLVILSRYTGPHWQELLRFAQKRSVPIAVHLDDNLLEVPAELKIDTYYEPSRKAALLGTLRESDLVIASTAPLASQLSGYEHRKIVYGDIYCSVMDQDFYPPTAQNENIRIGYMAGYSHKHDLEYVAEEIAAVLREYKNAYLEVSGFDFSVATSPFPADRIKFRTGTYGTYNGFRRNLPKLGWDIGLAPLRPIKYNKCKANTKWVEYCCSGIAVLAAHDAPYSAIPSDCVAFSDRANWQDNLANLMENPTLRFEMTAAAMTYLRKKFSLEAHAEQIKKIFSSVGVDLRG